MSEHHHHDHGTEQVSDKVLLWTTFVNIGLSVFEFIAGAIAGSVALMADHCTTPMMRRRCSLPISPARYPERAQMKNSLLAIVEPS